MLSSRDLFPGPNTLAVHSLADRELSVLAADGDANVVGHRHALTPMGPGDKPRGDSGVCTRALRDSREMCECRNPRGGEEKERGPTVAAHCSRRYNRGFPALPSL